jgi:hypothetical protein
VPIYVCEEGAKGCTREAFVQTPHRPQRILVALLKLQQRLPSQDLAFAFAFAFVSALAFATARLEMIVMRSPSDKPCAFFINL